MAIGPTFSPESVYDFLGPFDGGVNGAIAPLLLPYNYLARAVNATVRGTLPSQRSPFKLRSLTWPGGATPQGAFETGLFQGSCYFKPDNGVAECLMAMIGGHLFRIQINGNTFTASDVTLAGGGGTPQYNSTTLPQAWLWQAEKWVIVQNGQDPPMIFDNVTNRRAVPDTYDASGAPTQIISTILQGDATPATPQPNGLAYVPFPDIGSSCLVNLTTPYSGVYGRVIAVFQQLALGQAIKRGHWRIEEWVNTEPVGLQPNAQLTNVNNPAGTVLAGTPVVLQTTSTQLVTFGQVQLPSGQNQIVLFNTGSIIVHVSAACPATNGSTLVVGGLQVILDAGSGTQDITIHSATGNGGVINNGSNAQSNVTVTIDTTIATVVQAFTVAASVSAVLSVAYQGATGAAVKIGPYDWTIAPYVRGAYSHNTVKLTNIDQDPFLRNFDPPIRNNFITLATPATPVTTYLAALPELPTGKMGVYGMGRNWLCLPDGRTFLASDIVGSASGSLTNSYRDAVLAITENSFLYQGGVFVVPNSSGEIQAMIFTVTLDASLGQGPLAVLVEDSVFSCNAPVDRSQWQLLTNPILTQSLIAGGALSQWSTVNANGDVIFRSQDGIRSLILARRDFDAWGNVPISFEVSHVLDQDTPSLLGFSSAIVFDNRLLMTANPIQAAQGVYHPTMVVLNFDPISSLRGKAASVWDGEWNGINVLQLVKGRFQGVERAFAFCLNAQLNKVELHEIGVDDPSAVDDTATPIPWSVWSGSRFREQTNAQKRAKRLMDGEIFIGGISRPLTVSVYYRPDQWPAWILWRTFNVTPSPADPTFRSQVGLGEPSPMDCDETNNRPLREGYTFDLRVDITGPAELLGGRFKAVTIPDLPFPAPFNCS